MYRQLGQVQGSLELISASVIRMETTLTKHAETDTNNFALMRADVRGLTEIVDRIKKPVETFMSARNFIIGLLSLVATVGTILTLGPTNVWGWVSGWFHH